MVALLINSLASGGAERIALNISEGLHKDGEDIMLICLIRKNEYPIAKGLHVEYLSDENKYKRGFKLNKLFQLPLMLFRLKKLINQNNIQVVQSHLYSASILNVLARRIGAKHSVQIVNHMHISYEKNAGISGYFKIAVLKYTYRRADLLISISKRMRDDINLILLGKANITHKVIFNPHDIDSIILRSKEQITEFHFNPGTKYIVTAGRLVKRKKIETIIESFSEISQKYSKIELLILGDGEEFSPLTELAKKMNLDDKIHFLGFVSNPFKLISQSDIFILASESEGLPNAIIEAIICKTPVISTDCPTGPREIIAPNTDYNFQISNRNEICKYGILTPIGNHHLLSNAIETILNNYPEFEQKITAAFEFVKEFSRDKIITEYKKVLLPNNNNNE